MQKSFAHPNIMYKTDSINTTAIYAKDWSMKTTLMSPSFI
jgi:hypothetical protein